MRVLLTATKSSTPDPEPLGTTAAAHLRNSPRARAKRTESAFRKLAVRWLLSFKERMPQAWIGVDRGLNAVVQELRQGCDLVETPRLGRHLEIHACVPLSSHQVLSLKVGSL